MDDKNKIALLKAKLRVSKQKRYNLKAQVLLSRKELTDARNNFELAAKQRDEIATNLHRTGLEVVRLQKIIADAGITDETP